ncbi:large proline-rich protein BAG6-like isoform X2 [Ptychodera flava]|uniref:large proline-rich protein BAG6-like isoform X2 n=1 Tax=Ptychodera flava TaxID=63121 RepID=UPI00396A1A9B
MMELTIKTLDSQTRSFSVEDDITVKEFKEKIAKDVDIDANSQRLIYQGRVLQDDKKLAEYEVNGKVVHLVQRPPPQSRASTTRPSTTSTTTTSSSSTARSSRESIVVGAFTLPADVTDSNEVQRIVQQVISGMGDIGRNARVTSRQSADGSSVDVHINLGQLAVPQLHSESQLRVDHVRNMIRQAYETIDRLENPPGGSSRSGSDDRGSRGGAEGGATAMDASGSGGSTSTTRSSTTTSSSSSSSGGTPSLTEILNRLWNPDHPNMPVMADLIDEVMRLQRRLQPHLDRFQRYLREDPDFEEGVRMAQRHCNLVTEVLHFISHSYHGISDCMVDMTRPPPRVLRAPPTPVLPSLPQNPLQANINLTTVQSNTGSRMSTGATTSTSTSDTATTTASTPGTSRPSNTATSTTATTSTATSTPSSTTASAHNAAAAAGSAPSLAGILGLGSPIMMSISRTTAIPIAIRPGGRPTTGTTTSTTTTGSSTTGTDTTTTGTSTSTSTTSTSTTSATTSSTTTTSSSEGQSTPNVASLGNSIAELAQMIPVLQGLVQSVQAAGAAVTGISTRQQTEGSGSSEGQTATSTTTSTSSTASSSSSGSGTGTTTPSGAGISGMFATGGRTVPVANFFGLNAHRDQFLPCASRHFFLRRPATQAPETTTTTSSTSRTTTTTTSQAGSGNSEPQGEEQLADMIGNLVGSLINQHNPYLQPHPPPGTGDVSSDDDSMDGQANNNNANANPPAEPTNPVLASLLRGIRNLVGSPNNEDNPFTELFTSESNPRSQRADEVFMTIGRGIDEQLELARRGDDIPSAHSYMTTHGLQYHTMLGPGLLFDLIRFLARNLNFSEISNILLGQNEPLRSPSFRTKCQEFIKESVLDKKEPTEANIKEGADRFARNIVELLIVNPSNFPTKDDIDLIETNVEFFRATLIKLFNMVLNSSETREAYAVAVQGLLTRATHEWLVLNISILQNGQNGMEDIIKRRVRALTRDMNPLFRSWLTTIGPQNIRTLAENFQVRPDEVQCYIKKKGAAAGPSTNEAMTNGEPALDTRETSTSADEKMEVEQSVSQEQPVSQKKRASPDQTEFNDGAASTSPVTVETEERFANADGWQAAIPSDWVPVITNDISHQRRQGTQAPLSDAYLSGMPPKRRRLMTQRRPYGGVDTVLPNVLQRAVETASVQPITSREELAAELRGNTELHSAYEQQIRNSIQRRLRQDPNYNKQKYPNTETYFNQDKQ